MKVFCIMENPSLRKVIQRAIGQTHKTAFHNNPIRAMEIMKSDEPNVILFNFEDFPRHWESTYIFSKYILNKCRFILFFGRSFLINDSSKAEFLGVETLPWHTDAKFFMQELKDKI